MREIKFRGKRIDNNEWSYGYLFQIWERVYILLGTTNGIPNMVEVDPKTVGQSITLPDKSGVEIYENDVMKNPKNNVIVYISFKDGMFGFTRNMDNAFTFIDESDRWEIIGNTSDNPELIK